MANVQHSEQWKPPKWYHEKSKASSSSFLNEKKLNRGKILAIAKIFGKKDNMKRPNDRLNDRSSNSQSSFSNDSTPCLSCDEEALDTFGIHEDLMEYELNSLQKELEMEKTKRIETDELNESLLKQNEEYEKQIFDLKNLLIRMEHENSSLLIKMEHENCMIVQKEKDNNLMLEKKVETLSEMLLRKQKSLTEALDAVDSVSVYNTNKNINKNINASTRNSRSRITLGKMLTSSKN